MGEWFSALSGFEQVSFCIAVFGSAFFVAKLIMQSLGMGSEGMELEADADVEADAEAVDSSAENAEGAQSVADAADAVDTVDQPPAVVEGLHLFSVHGMALGLGMGGWSAMGVYTASGIAIVSAIAGLVIGFASMVVHAKIMAGLSKLQEDPTIQKKDTVGLIGTVYLRIPKYGEGKGKVNVIVHESLEEYDAICHDETVIPTGEKVRVVDVDDEGMLIVQRVSEEG